MKCKLLKAMSLMTVLCASAISYSPASSNPEEYIGPAPTEFDSGKGGELVDVKKAQEEDTLPNELTIHFQRDTGGYENLAFYLWTESVDGKQYIADGVDDFGMYITVDPHDFGSHNTFCFIIKKKTEWAGQSADTEIPYSKFEAKDGKLEVWAIDGEGNTIEVYKTIEETQGGKITYAKFENWKKLKVECTHVLDSYKLYAYNSEFVNSSTNNQKFNKYTYLIKEGSHDSETLEIDFAYPIQPSLQYLIEVHFKESGRNKATFVSFEHLYDTPRFEKYYTYNGDDLGVVYTKEKSNFKLWAPCANSVKLRIYDVGTPQYLNPEIGSNLYSEFNMAYKPGGVWEAEIAGDLNGKYYTYYVNNFKAGNEVVDPYARACGINGLRGMILDFDTTDPEGWDDLPLVWNEDPVLDLKSPTDLSVYEVHVRDLTMDDSWNGTKKAGTFEAFREEGTSFSKNGTTVTTGFDHIKELGVNAVQILPFFDGANSEVDKDETNNKVDTAYNWGYNPLNYNCVEGTYSVDPYHGEVRVKELKELVKAYAETDNHIRIIMDVVYNHVASVSSNNLNKIMPKYFFRINNEGGYHDGAGCGNEVKTEAPMMRKFIVDSVKWWATEYKIKGFRFDLMGLIDTTTMRLVKDALYDIDPDNVCWGEGWALSYNGIYKAHNETNADGSTREVVDIDGTKTQRVYQMLNSTPESKGHLAGFNDVFRNAIKGGNDGGWGSTDKYPGYGFITQGNSDASGNADYISKGILGIHKHYNEFEGGNPVQTLNYTSCHDNWTLYDQLHYRLGYQKDGVQIEPEFNEVAEAMLACQSAVAFSSGIAFFNSGEELFRTKIEYETELDEGEIPYFEDMYGTAISHNSYKSSDKTNAFRYDQKISVTYKGEEVETNKYFKKYCEMIHKRTSDMRVSFPNNYDGSKVSTWNNGGCGLGTWINSGTTQYWVLLSGREATTIGFQANGNYELYFNSKGGVNEGYSSYGNACSMSARQLLVFKKI